MPTDPAFTVIAADVADVAVVRALRLAALADTPDAFCATHAEEAALPESAWRDRLTATDVVNLVARSASEPVGLTVVQLWGSGEVAGVASVWVAPGGRGHGVGDALLEAALAEARARGYRRAVLEVGDHNVPAQRLYARHGFRPTGVTSTLPPPRTHVAEHELAVDLSPTVPG